MFDRLHTEANQVLSTLFGLTDNPVVWTRPMEASHGDLTTTVALRAAKILSMSPRNIAEKLAKALADSPSVVKAEVAGAGYVNVWLTPMALLEELTAVEASVKGKAVRKKDAPVIVEYSQ